MARSSNGVGRMAATAMGLLLLLVATKTVAVVDEGWRRGMAQDLWVLEATPVLGR